MSKESRQRLREEAKRQEKRQAHRKKLRWVLPLIVILLVAAGVVVWNRRHAQSRKEEANFRQPRTFQELLALSPAQLEECDIGLMNLLCAEGLPGAEDLDIPACLKQLDAMADRVMIETERHMYRFREHPSQFRNSRGYYQMLMIGTVLTEDYKIRYNPKLSLPQMDGKIPTLADGANSKDAFIHGLLGGNHYGTCASMPVLVTAIARRRGYPVNLAGAAYHLYARYEEGNGKHFNIEPTVAEGFLTPTDDDYRNWPTKPTDEEVQGHGWLKPLSNREAMAGFLKNRAICLGNAKRYAEAKEMILLAASLLPVTPQHQKSINYNLQCLQEAPLGDKWDRVYREINQLGVLPAGTRASRSTYLLNRQTQVCYFIEGNTNFPSVEKAVNDLDEELAAYRAQVAIHDFALEQYQQKLLCVTVNGGKEIRIPAAVLPPPLNRTTIPANCMNHIQKLNLQDCHAIVVELWKHHKQRESHWMEQASLLPSW